MTSSPACARRWSSRAWSDGPRKGDKSMTRQQASGSSLPQTLVGAAIGLIGVALAAGAVSIPSTAGYSGIGPNFLPWLVAGVLTLCGVLIVREARTGGYRNMGEP